MPCLVSETSGGVKGKTLGGCLHLLLFANDWCQYFFTHDLKTFFMNAYR